MSSGLITTPDGFEGEFKMISLVLGVIARSTMSALTLKLLSSSVCNRMQFAPA